MVHDLNRFKKRAVVDYNKSKRLRIPNTSDPSSDHYLLIQVVVCFPV